MPRLRRAVSVMDELEGVRWAAGLGFDTYGVRIGVRLETSELLPRLRAYLPPHWQPTVSPRVDFLYSIREGGASHAGYRLYAGAELVAETELADAALEILRDCLDFSVALIARPWTFVHAGVVGWRGRAIVLPGRSGAGKTTLVTSLVQAGAEYYSDEYAVFDEHGRVHPYARALAVKDPHAGRPRRVPVETLGGRAGTRPLAVGLVAVTDHRAGARWRPRSLSRGEAVLALLDNAVRTRMCPTATLRALRRGVSSAVAVQSRRGEAARVVPSLLEHAG